MVSPFKPTLIGDIALDILLVPQKLVLMRNPLNTIRRAGHLYSCINFGMNACFTMLNHLYLVGKNDGGSVKPIIKPNDGLTGN